MAVSEASTHWQGVIEDLLHRGLPTPELVIADGHGGLTKAIAAWPGVRVQTCTQHKWRNLSEHCPTHARAELKRDWDRIVYASNGKAARKAYDSFLRKWSTPHRGFSVEPKTAHLRSNSPWRDLLHLV